jgi:Tol biopolymer transport system component
VRGRRAPLVVLLLAVCASAPGAGAGSGSLIAFWNDDPVPSIWAVRPDGSGRISLLHSSQNAKRARLSPDRRWVAFDGAPPGKPAMSDFEIQIVRRDGSGRRTLTRSAAPNTDAQWSPDGALLSFTRAPAFDWTKASIWSVARDGTHLRRIARGQFGRWSPDGTRLVLDSPTPTSQGDIFVVDANGTNRRLVLASPALDQPADWSPDGTKILFTRYDRDGPGSSVYVVNVDGSGLRKLARGLAGTWSPDGTQIVYTTDFPGRVFVMRSDGSHKRPVGRVVGAEPDWR